MTMRVLIVVLMAVSVAGCIGVDKPLYEADKEDTYYMPKLEGTWAATLEGRPDEPMHLVVTSNDEEGYTIRENRAVAPRNGEYAPDMEAYLLQIGGYNFMDWTVVAPDDPEGSSALEALTGYHFPLRVQEIVFDDETGGARLVLLIPSQDDWMLGYLRRHPELDITHERIAMPGDEADRLIFKGSRENLRTYLTACAQSVTGFDAELTILLEPEDAAATAATDGAE